jgi:beta-glucanase (GH16 family)
MVHRLDWTRTECVWYVDRGETARISYQTPRDPAQIIFNAWSDGGAWSGNMWVHDAAYLWIQWIEMVFNMTGEDDGSRKRSGCYWPRSPQ